MSVHHSDVAFLLVGTLGTVAVVISTLKTDSGGAGDGSMILEGVAAGLLSLVSSSAELLLVRHMGADERLDPLDLVFYMPIPVVALLIGPIFLFGHAVTWREHGVQTDWQIFVECWRRNSSSLLLILFSGIFSIMYNMFLYSLVQKLSPAHASYAGNFNKVAIIMLALMCGFEHIPPMPWCIMFIFGAVANIGSFGAIHVRKSPALMRFGSYMLFGETEKQETSGSSGDQSDVSFGLCALDFPKTDFPIIPPSPPLRFSASPVPGAPPIPTRLTSARPLR